jgi:hypothetical protein
MTKQCAIEGCDGKSFSRGLCRKHYNHHRHHGTLDQFARSLWGRTQRLEPNECVIEGCDREAHSRGLCGTHYTYHSRHGTLDQFVYQSPTNLCLFCGETKDRSEFPERAGRKCKKCFKEYAKNWRMERLEDPIIWANDRANKAEYNQKPEVKARSNKRRQDNKEKIKQYGRAYYVERIDYPHKAALKREFITKESAYAENRHELVTQHAVLLHRQQLEQASKIEKQIADLDKGFQAWFEEFTQDPVASKIVAKLMAQREELKANEHA